jgi:hypothetical protein
MIVIYNPNIFIIQATDSDPELRSFKVELRLELDYDRGL